MATRATYKFESNYGVTAVIYNHWDGYPEGAAEHLDGVRTAEDFIRKNENSEITRSHEFHSDTEYRYDITAVKAEVAISASKRYGFGVEKWEQFFDGTLEEFLDQFKGRLEANA